MQHFSLYFTQNCGEYGFFSVFPFRSAIVYGILSRKVPFLNLRARRNDSNAIRRTFIGELRNRAVYRYVFKRIHLIIFIDGFKQRTLHLINVNGNVLPSTTARFRTNYCAYA